MALTFGEKMRELRDRVGFTEAQLAEQSGVPLGSIHHYGRDSRQPNFGAVVRIAKALGVTCEAFAECVETDLAS